MSQLIDNLNTIVSIKTDIRSAIENKGVDMTGVSFPDYPAAISSIQTGGGSAVIEGLTITSNGTYTAREGVDGYSPIEVDVPAVGWDQKSVTEGTIEIINLDNSASFVASRAFKDKKNLQTVNLPYATIVYLEAFRNCTSLTQVDLPMCSYIDRFIFYYCSSLSQISLPMCSRIGDTAFNNCTSLSQISLPMCSRIDNDAFFACSSLSQISLPMCSHIGRYAFAYCPLTQVSLPMCSFIDNYTFQNCYSLSIITIGYSSVCSLINSMTFDHTQITSSTGSIFVPASLVDSYKSATNWSYFSTQIFPIPE